MRKRTPKRTKGANKPDDKNAVNVEIQDPEDIPYDKGK